MSPVFGT